MSRYRQSGMSLMEVLVALGISGAITLGTLNFFTHSGAGMRVSEKESDLASIAVDIQTAGREATSTTIDIVGTRTTLTLNLNSPGAPAQISFSHDVDGLSIWSTLSDGTILEQGLFRDIGEFTLCYGSDPACPLSPQLIGTASANIAFVETPDRYIRFRLKGKLRSVPTPLPTPDSYHLLPPAPYQQAQVQSAFYRRNPSSLPYVTYVKGYKK